VTRIQLEMIAEARRRYGHIEPCEGRELGDCFTFEAGRLMLWFNDATGSTRMVTRRGADPSGADFFMGRGGFATSFPAPRPLSASPLSLRARRGSPPKVSCPGPSFSEPQLQAGEAAEGVSQSCF
jgi:hypothetical protein